MKKSVSILVAIIFAINLNTQAYDFLSVYNGDTIYYNITSSLPRTVEVTYNKNNLIPDYSGDLIIPDSVFFLDNYYKVTSISYCNFASCTDLTSIGIPNSVTSIGGSAFYGCTSLTSITIPNSVTSIGFCAFASCTGLTSITIPSSVTSISEGAFQDCTGLTSITIPNSVTSIGQGAFFGCVSLTSITIPNSVTSIGGVAFLLCTGLTSITCNAIIPPAVSYSFDSVNFSLPFYVPCNSISLYQQTPDWSSFTNYRCNSGLSDELKFSNSAKLYPNPTNNKSKLEVEGLKTDADVIVSDLFGRVIKSYKINPTMNELEIDVSSFDKGIYSVSVQNNNINVSKKLIVQ